jgi:hypothetical protein
MFAYADRFGNVRLSVRKSEELRNRLQRDKKVKVLIEGKCACEARYVTSLADISVGEMGIYENIADAQRPFQESGYWELVKRSDHCLEDTSMAYDVLKGYAQDVWNADIELITEKVYNRRSAINIKK